jgi:hypothetical protein
MVKLVSIRRMIYRDYQNLPGSLQRDGMLGFYIENDVHLCLLLDDCDYVVFVVDIDGKQYTAYYGFPGDNPSGAFKMDDKTWYYFGEGINSHQIPNTSMEEFAIYPENTKIDKVWKTFVDWYLDVTENESDYEMLCVR